MARGRRRVLRLAAGHLGLPLALGVLLLGLLAPLVAPYGPLEMHPGQELRPPSRQHFLGSDEFGRDILSRVLFGARLSLAVGLLSVAIGTLVGGALGLSAGFWGGALETLATRLADSLLSFPAIILGIAVAAVLGPGAVNAAIAVGIVNVPTFTRLTWSSVLVEKEKEYVQAAECLGARDPRLVGRHILPNVLAPLLVQATIASAQAILLEASLSFLGLGAQPPQPSWGAMLNDARQFLREAPWYGVFPGLALSTLLLGLNLTADAIRDALDPRLARA
ncbi:MAG TPA: ABC transporter permease [Methylomirabilota bacterium]|jgi:peptide/nickel transport system permease protein|nr:ABC transporter permease [Methylomirabilota bacterium]